jgi:hypothetical protein
MAFEKKTKTLETKQSPKCNSKQPQRDICTTITFFFQLPFLFLAHHIVPSNRYPPNNTFARHDEPDAKHTMESCMVDQKKSVNFFRVPFHSPKFLHHHKQMEFLRVEHKSPHSKHFS